MKKTYEQCNRSSTPYFFRRHKRFWPCIKRLSKNANETQILKRKISIRALDSNVMNSKMVYDYRRYLKEVLEC